MNKPKVNQTDGLSYFGTIQVQLRKEECVLSHSVFHNNGTPLLFEAIAKQVSGFETYPSIAPRYLDWQDNNSKSLLKSPVEVVGTTYIMDDSGSRVLFRGLITYYDKEPKPFVQNTKLCLLNNDEFSLAEVMGKESTTVKDQTDLDELWGKITSGKECVIEWTMEFTNGSNATPTIERVEEN